MKYSMSVRQFVKSKSWDKVRAEVEEWGEGALSDRLIDGVTDELLGRKRNDFDDLIDLVEKTETF